MTDTCGRQHRRDDDAGCAEAPAVCRPREEGHIREFLSTLKDEELTRMGDRGQVALLLRSLGYTPGNF